MRWLSIRVVLCLGYAMTLSAQTPAVDRSPILFDSVLRANRYVLELSNGTLSGRGAEFLREVRGTQFVALAEPHNNKDVPAFTTALFRALNQQLDYGYLAIESGSAMVTPLGSSPRAGNRDSVRAYARRYPNGLQFTSDQELEMIAEVGRISRAPGARFRAFEHRQTVGNCRF